LIKNLHECKGYKLQRSAVYNSVSEQRLNEEQHQQAAGEVRNSRQASGQTQSAHKTSTKLSRCWVRKTNLRATVHSEK